jgi:carbamoyl-phosphate synthase large subunit
VPLAKVATRVMMGATLEELRAEGLFAEPTVNGFVSVKEAVLPWNRFPGEDSVLGPEMRATGEVMGIARDMATAYAKAFMATGEPLPAQGTVFISLADRDKPEGAEVAARFANLGFRILATGGTADYLADRNIASVAVDKVGDGPWDPVRLISEDKVDLVINTPRGRRARGDGRLIRQASQRAEIPSVTTLAGARAAVDSIEAGAGGVLAVASLQEYHAQGSAP